MLSQVEKAEVLLELHHGLQPLLLVNAWDAASARIVESCGYPAVATTSAGIAYLEGFADGQAIGREGMLAGVARVVAHVSVPVTADMEGGYGETVDDAIATAVGVIAAGAVGLNFEDGATGSADPLLDTQLQARRIAAIRRVAEDSGVPLVINARTDTYLREVGDPKDRLRLTLERAGAYAAAGADSIFVPGVADAYTIRELVSGVGLPLNVLCNERSPSLAELASLGVKRISFGAWTIGHALRAFQRFALAARERPEGPFAPDRMTHSQLNALCEHPKG